MSTIQELLRELCPNGVEHRPLGETFSRLRGTPITARQMQEIATPNGSITIFAGGKTKISANEKDIRRANITRVPAVLVQSRGIIDVIYCETPFTFKNEMWAYTHKERTSVKFLYYYLKGRVETLRKIGSEMGSLPQIAIGDTEKIPISLPPLPVQEEIVRRLDAMQDVVEALETELALRRKQYEAVRGGLFSDLRVSTKRICPLEECCELLDRFRKPITKGDRITGEYPYYGANGIQDYVSDYLFEGRFVLIGEDGSVISENGNPIVTWAEGKIWVNNHAHVLREKNGVLLRFLFQYLQTVDITVLVHGSIPKLTAGALKVLPIPVPPLPVQEEIAKKLDAFDELVNVALPAEIAARRRAMEAVRERCFEALEKAE